MAAKLIANHSAGNAIGAKRWPKPRAIGALGRLAKQVEELPYPLIGFSLAQ